MSDVPERKVPGFWQAVLFMAIFWSVSGMVSLVAGAVGAVIAVATGAALAEITNASWMTWVGGVANILGFAVAILVGKKWSGRSWGEILPLRRFSPLLVLPLVLCALGFAVILSEMDNALQYFVPMPEFLREMMRQLSGGGAASFFVLVVVAPLTEEAFFRGLVLRGFLKRFGERRAIVLSSVLFALVHLNPYQFVGAFVLGCLAAWVRIRSGSLWPPIVVHALNNGLIFLCVLLPIDIPGFTSMEHHSFQPAWFDAGGIVFLAAGLALLVLVVRRVYPRRA